MFLFILNPLNVPSSEIMFIVSLCCVSVYSSETVNFGSNMETVMSLKCRLKTNNIKTFNLNIICTL